MLGTIVPATARRERAASAPACSSPTGPRMARRIRRGQRIGNERANLLSHDPETLLSFMPTLESVRFLYKNAQVFEQLDCGAAPGWTPGCRSRGPAAAAHRHVDSRPRPPCTNAQWRPTVNRPWVATTALPVFCRRTGGCAPPQRATAAYRIAHRRSEHTRGPDQSFAHPVRRSRDLATPRRSRLEPYGIVSCPSAIETRRRDRPRSGAAESPTRRWRRPVLPQT